MINDQEFTKTSNTWGVDNQSKGTNTNRIVVFNKPVTENLTFSRMLRELQRDQGFDPVELVSQWDEKVKQTIADAFQEAWSRGKFQKFEIRLPQGLSNQSRGTRLWAEFRPILEDHLDGFSFNSCKKTGYPDKQLVSDSETSFAFEEKAHTNWNESDGNRVVICSSTKRLRATFTPPINHVWATLYHSVRDEENHTVCTIHQLDLHFAEPGTLVARRLEISTSNKLLHQSVKDGIHTKESFGSFPTND
jgi:hypothetical protein